ncbi:uncharacterized protein LOC141876003 isoform X2 [Acropora palmata]
MPSVLISLKNGEPCFSCPSELESSFSSFINNTEVRRAFSRSLLQHFPRQFTSSSNPVSQTHGKVGLKSKIPLCSDYSEYSVADLRALVVSAVKSGNSKIIWGRRECQPSWWPQTIAFLDPNNAGKKEMRGDDLVVVMNAYGKHQMQEQETQPQQQGASNKDSINNNFENVPFTDCDNDNNNRSSHQVDCNSNVNSNHDCNDNTNNSDNRSSDNSTDYSNDGNIDNCNKSKNTDCNINNNTSMTLVTVPMTLV